MEKYSEIPSLNPSVDIYGPYTSNPTLPCSDELFGIQRSPPPTSTEKPPLSGFSDTSSISEKPPPYATYPPHISSTATASVASSVMKHNFAYDVLLIYDPDSDFYAYQDLLTYLEPKNLHIFDFARDRPAGPSQQEVLAGALQACKFTCIIVTRSFINNFWLKFKADMAIQHMIQNEHAQHTLVVVVMDHMLKIEQLPLDLQTLSPIFSSERYFKHRISKAFGEAPFPLGKHLQSMQSPTKRQQSYQPSFTAVQNYREKPLDEKFHPDPLSFHDASLNGTDAYPLKGKSYSCQQKTSPSGISPTHSADSFHSSNYSSIRDWTPAHSSGEGASDSESSSLLRDRKSFEHRQSEAARTEKPRVSSPAQTRSLREPREHTEDLSAFGTSSSLPNPAVKRLVSVTRSSTGSRQPTESDESMCTSPQSAASANLRATHSSPRSVASPRVPLLPSIPDPVALPETDESQTSTPHLFTRIEHFAFDDKELATDIKEEVATTRSESIVDSLANVTLEISLDVPDHSACDVERSTIDTVPTSSAADNARSIDEDRKDSSLANSLKSSFTRLKKLFS